MNRTELFDLIRNGENSTLEFKRDDIQNHALAKELVAFLNLEGGTVLLGVEDDGSISGTTRNRLEEWVSELCRVKINPPTGRVRIAAPQSMSLDTIRLFAISRLGWIKRQQRRQRAQDREPPREYIERESHYLWGRRYLLHIVEDAPRSFVSVEHRHIELGVPEGMPTGKSGRPFLIDGTEKNFGPLPQS